MEQRCDQDTNRCMFFIPDYNIGFKLITSKKGDHYYEQTHDNHTLFFLLEGKIKLSYNDYINHLFVAGDIFFIPQTSEIFGSILTNTKILVLTFNNRVESLCDRCRLSQTKKYIPEINYCFRPLKITDTLVSFATLMEKYIEKGIKCRFLHELKQKELFVVMGAEYSEKELVELFYPIIDGNIEFKTRIMENYRYSFDISALAKKFGMSYSPFLRKFKKEFGITAQDWMLKQKAKHIKARLAIPTTSISDVVREFDFTDTSHFVRFCRKHYGCTPSELVKDIRSKNAEK